MKKLLSIIGLLSALNASAATQNFHSWVAWPAYDTSVSGVTTLANVTLDADGEAIGMIMQAPSDLVISNVVFRTALTTTGGTVTIRVETVGGDGNPSGTLFASGSNGSYAVQNTDDNVLLTSTLGSACLVTQGSYFAIVITAPSGYNGSIARYDDDNNNFPYTTHWTGSWTKGGQRPIIGLSDASGAFHFLNAKCVLLVSQATYNSGTGTNRRGNIMTLPVPATAMGVWAWIDGDGDYEFRLYDSDGTTVLGTVAVDADFRSTANSDLVFHYFNAPIALSRNTNYRLVAVPTTGTDILLNEFTVGAAAQMDSNVGGQAVHLTTWNGSAWTETPTARAEMGLLLRGFDDGTGSGGGTSSHSYAH
jgi:hypothetical protein